MEESKRLSQEDKARIERVIDDRGVETGIFMKGTIGYRAVFEVAEYCTIYERQQQAKKVADLVAKDTREILQKHSLNQKLINPAVMSERGIEFLKNKEAAFKLVEDQGKLLKEYEQADNVATNLLAECKAKIKQLEANRADLLAKVEEQQDWIDVKDKLPKENTFVLINGNTFVGYFDLDHGWMDFLHNKTTVTFWQPLPKLP